MFVNVLHIFMYVHSMLVCTYTIQRIREVRLINKVNVKHLLFSSPKELLEVLNWLIIKDFIVSEIFLGEILFLFLELLFLFFFVLVYLFLLF